MKLLYVLSFIGGMVLGVITPGTMPHSTTQPRNIIMAWTKEQVIGWAEISTGTSDVQNRDMNYYIEVTNGAPSVVPPDTEIGVLVAPGALIQFFVPTGDVLYGRATTDKRPANIGVNLVQGV